MTEWEGVVAVAFLFGFLLCFSSLREESADPNLVRVLLLGNAALSTVLLWANFGQSFRSIVLTLMLAMGATEASFWTAKGLNRLLKKPPRAKDEAWGFRNDGVGCALAILAGLALITFMATGSSEFD